MCGYTRRVGWLTIPTFGNDLLLPNHNIQNNNNSSPVIYAFLQATVYVQIHEKCMCVHLHN